MFSSGNNTNNTNNHPYHHHQLALPFYQYSSSTNPLITQETGDSSNILYHYYQHPLITGQQLLQAGYVSTENTAAANMAATVATLTNSTNYASGGGIVTNSLHEKPVVKKDRHSKIYTAQGLRDRRVRLSTEIARQFFDLQDLLGYDKASETISWLINKSKKDIKELVEMRTKNFSNLSDSELFSLNNHQETENEEPDRMVSQNDSLIVTSKENKKMKSQKAAGNQKHKKDSRTLTNEREKFLGLNQAGSTSHLFEVGEKSGSLMRDCVEFGGRSTDPIANNNHELCREDIMEESIMITRKLKPTSTSLVYDDQRNNFSCLPQNWDINGAASCDATPSMNLSTELLISGKAWEACNNQRLE